MSDWAGAGAVQPRPEVTISEADRDRLVALAIAAAQGRIVGCGALLLLDEVTWAVVVPAGEMPSRVIVLRSRVEHRNGATGATRRVRLVYPHESGTARGRVSVLAPGRIIEFGPARADRVP
ncbi:MAG: nucleoside diphosphate kinase regulator [Acetobacteraceae bacterium]|nr:nucleoside diphosphate kinase regulator [Acetobacteraceae bacterium]